MSNVKSPFHVLLRRRVTEKSETLLNLQNSESNRCVKRFKKPIYTFEVHPKANKIEVRNAIESCYADKNVKVEAVRMIVVKPKKKRMRGRVGKTATLKKAIVTLREGDTLDDL